MTLLPSGKGFGKAVEGQASSAFKGAEKQSSGFFSKVKKGLKWAAIGVAGVATTVAGLALKGGLDRALNIEDAQAKLKGLGHDTKAIEQIMGNALDSVKGTAFGLDAAATVAAGAVAAGIKPGKELEGVLKTVANSAATSGTSMEEMGAVFNTVAATNRAYTRDIQKLADRGLPIWQKLSDHFGVTTDEVRNLASQGKISFEDFAAAAEDAAGTVADEMGKTTRGMYDNMKAAMSRWGEVFWSDGLPLVKEFFGEVTIFFDGLTDRTKEWSETFKERFGDAFSFEGLGEKALDVLDRIVKAITTGPMSDLMQALQPMLPLIAELASMLGDTLGDAFFQVGEALAPVLPMLAEALVDAVIELTPFIADLVEAIVPLIPALIELLPPLVELAIEILPLLVWAVEKLVPVLEWAIENFGGLLEAIKLLYDFMNGDTTPEEYVDRVNEMGGILGWLVSMFNRGATGVANFARRVREKIDEAKQKFSEFKSRVSEVFSNPIGWLSSAGRDIVQGLINGIRAKMGEALATIRSLGEELVSTAKSFLGIHSPSRVFRDEVGKMIGLGLLEGIDDSGIRARIDRSVNHMVSIPEGLRAAGLPGEITLLDQDGSILSNTRVLTERAIDRFAVQSIRAQR